LFILNSFAYAVALLFLIAKQNSAKNFLKRARAKGSENNKDSINGKEVQKELQEATKRDYRRAFELL
jgi:hypothetical protein